MNLILLDDTQEFYGGGACGGGGVCVKLSFNLWKIYLWYGVLRERETLYFGRKVRNWCKTVEVEMDRLL